MNEPFTNKTNPEETDIAKKLHSLAEQTQAPSYFISELEAQLREKHRPKATWYLAWRDLTRTLGWVALVLAVSFLLIWSIRSLVHTPQPASNDTPTTQQQDSSIAPTRTPQPIQTESPTPIIPQGIGYDWRGTKLYLAQPLPQSSTQANVYQLKKDQQAALEEARALADRFGIHGELYTAFDHVFNINDYYFTDGKQALQVYSSRRFTYTSDLSKTSRLIRNTPAQNADKIISEFLEVRGFDFPMKITATDFFGGYSVQPLAPDGLPVQYESFTFPPLLVFLDESGNVRYLEATIMDFDSTPVGTYGIITAQEALNKLLDDNEQGGKLEFFNAADNKLPQGWSRSHPDHQTITTYGAISIYLPVDSSQPPFITLDGVPVIGNIKGMKELSHGVYVEATGQYVVENGIRKFNVASWNANFQPAHISGTLKRDGDQIILTASGVGTDQQAPLIGVGMQYPLIDPPADLPLDNKPDSQFFIEGVLVDGKLSWYYIQYVDNINNRGGGGGGGGLGFYQLNLSGTPVPFPTAPAAPETSGSTYIVQENDTAASIAANYGISIERLAQANNLSDSNMIYVGQSLFIPERQELIEQHVTDMRGFLSVIIHKKADGTQVKEYSLQIYESNEFMSYPLTGADLSELDAYNALPVLISGILTTYGPTSTLNVDSYKIPFPNLEFQILKGTQRSEQLDGQTVIIFTTEDGKSYVEFMVSTQQTTNAYVGLQGDSIQQEVLIVPDETFGGMPVIRVYQSSVMGGASEMQIQANHISVFDESSLPIMPSDYTLPTLTIEQVELVYFVNNIYYQVNDPNYSQRSPYIQPVWHFHGHFDTGDEFDTLIQALKQEFLLPKLAPSITPG